MKFADVKALKRAQENAEKDRVAFEKKIESIRAEIRAELEKLGDVLNECRINGNYDEYERVSEQKKKLEDKLSFYESNRYVSPIKDSDIADSWNEIAKDYQKKLNAKVSAFEKARDNVIKAYVDYCKEYSSAVEECYEFTSALDKNNLSPAGFPTIEFAEIRAKIKESDLRLDKFIADNDIGLSIKLHGLMLRGIPMSCDL